MPGLNPSSRLPSLALAVILGAQIWMSVVVFRKWDDDMYKNDKIAGSSSSDYKDPDGAWRGTWEMQGMLSDLGKGSVFPGNRAKIVYTDALANVDKQVFEFDKRDHHMGAATKIAYGGGACTGTTEAATTGACGTGKKCWTTTNCNSGLCGAASAGDGTCVCDPLSYGDQCESSLKDLGVVTAVCTGDTVKQVVPNAIPSTWNIAAEGSE